MHRDYKIGFLGTAAVLTLGRAMLAGLALLASGCGDLRCHTAHVEVSYVPAHTTSGKTCVTTSINPHREVCVPYTNHHPPSCDVRTVCDFRCAALDEGRAEAHAEHATQSTPLVNRDPQLCTDGGLVR